MAFLLPGAVLVIGLLFLIDHAVKNETGSKG